MQSKRSIRTVANMPLHLDAYSNHRSDGRLVEQAVVSPSAITSPQVMPTAQGTPPHFEGDRKRVNFSDVLMRRYDLTCTGYVNHGPGIGLDWSFTDADTVSLEDFEQSRSPRRPREQLIVGPRQRANVLMNSQACNKEQMQRICSRRIAPARSLSTLLPKTRPSQQRFNRTICHQHADHHLSVASS
jgi:hypothetical protein